MWGRIGADCRYRSSALTVCGTTARICRRSRLGFVRGCRCGPGRCSRGPARPEVLASRRRICTLRSAGLRPRVCGGSGVGPCHRRRSSTAGTTVANSHLSRWLPGPDARTASTVVAGRTADTKARPSSASPSGITSTLARAGHQLSVLRRTSESRCWISLVTVTKPSDSYSREAPVGLSASTPSADRSTARVRRSVRCRP